MSKKFTVTDFAKKYGVSSKEIIKELNGQGVDTPEAEKRVIPEDMIELVDSYFSDLYDSHDAEVPSSRESRKGRGTPRKGFAESPANSGRTKKKNAGGPARDARESASGSGGEILLAPPIIVKDLAEAGTDYVIR